MLQRPSGRPRGKHRQPGTRGPRSVHRSLAPAAARGTAGMDSENPAQAGKANHSGPRRITRPVIRVEQARGALRAVDGLRRAAGPGPGSLGSSLQTGEVTV